MTTTGTTISCSSNRSNACGSDRSTEVSSTKVRWAGVDEVLDVLAWVAAMSLVLSGRDAHHAGPPVLDDGPGAGPEVWCRPPPDARHCGVRGNQRERPAHDLRSRVLRPPP